MKDVAQSLQKAFEEQKPVQIKIKHSDNRWSGWVRNLNASPDNTYCIYEFERLLNPNEYQEDAPNTVSQKILSFWIEDVEDLE